MARQMAAQTLSPLTLPAPASSKAHPATTGKSTATTAPAKAAAPATTSPATTPVAATPAAPTTASTPTTTYVPAGATTPPPGAGVTGASGVTGPVKSTLGSPPLTHARAKHSGTLSTGAVAICVVAVLLILACIAWALARRRAFEPHWLLSLRHAMAEAGFRASATWAEFADWVRLGH